MKNTAGVGIGFVLFVSLAALPAGAQDQSPSNSQDSSSGSSLGDYARQVRKDPVAKAKPKVFDNDNLSKQDKLSIVGTPSASTSTTTNAGEAKETSASSAPATEPKTSEAKAGATEGATEATTPAGEKVPTGEK